MAGVTEVIHPRRGIRTTLLAQDGHGHVIMCYLHALHERPGTSVHVSRWDRDLHTRCYYVIK